MKEFNATVQDFMHFCGYTESQAITATINVFLNQ